MKSGQSNDTQNPVDDSRIALEAIEWLVRLLDTEFDPEEPYPDPLERQDAFLRWLALDAAHVQASLETLEVEHRAANADPQHLIKIQELLASSPATDLPIAEYQPSSRRAGPPPLSYQTSPRDQGTVHLIPRRWSVTLAAIAAGLAAIVVGLVWGPRPVTGTSVYYSTAVGERQTVLLEDGSTVVLSAATRVAITYDRHTREVRLLAGEAFFDVHHDTARPFRVIADDVFIEDLGTQFDVDRRTTATRVTVAQGSIQLACGCVTRESLSSTVTVSQPPSSIPAHPSATVTLVAGDEANITYADGSLSRRSLSPDELAQTIGWRNGELWFNGDPLSVVVEKLNQYSSHRIVVADPSVANVQIDGMCKTSQAEDCAKVVGHASGVVVVAVDPNDQSTIRLGRNPSTRS